MVLRPEDPRASLRPTLISGKDQSQGSVCSTFWLSVSVKGASVSMEIHGEDTGFFKKGMWRMDGEEEIRAGGAA